MNGARGAILIVDDEQVVRESLEQWFQDEGYFVKACGNGREGLDALVNRRFDVALIDIKMPGMDGMELQSRLHEADPELLVIIMTGYASVETAVNALKKGAYDYITKPADPDELSHLIAKAVEHQRNRREVERLKENLEAAQPETDLIGKSPAMKRVNEFVQMVAPTESTVLITGESGTGKEVVARAIHRLSPRRNMPMVVIHCGALTETLLESELFGHERGAFTGAQYRKKGKFEAADGGTVFLDEIADISLRTQTDLLRVLQEKEVIRVGGTQALKIDFRCVAATNKRLEDLVKAGTFRPDLYYRLHVLCIELPPLRERREDIPLLVDHFLHKLCATTNRPMVPQVTPQAMELLTAHDWPGNVRELENAVERALVVCRDQRLDSGSFSFLQRMDGSGGMTLEDAERVHIDKVWRMCNGNHSKAARVLDIDRTTLYNKLRKYGLKE